MKKENRNAILQSAAKTLAWALYAVTGYGSMRTPISIERFDRELRAATRQWRATHRNLKKPKEQ